MSMAVAMVVGSPIASMSYGAWTVVPDTEMPSLASVNHVPATTRTAPIWIASAPASRNSWTASRIRLAGISPAGSLMVMRTPGPEAGRRPGKDAQRLGALTGGGDGGGTIGRAAFQGIAGALQLTQLGAKPFVVLGDVVEDAHQFILAQRLQGLRARRVQLGRNGEAETEGEHGDDGIGPREAWLGHGIHPSPGAGGGNLVRDRGGEGSSYGRAVRP
jgi:hypothetical protein